MAPTATATAAEEQQHPRKALGLAAHDASGHLSPIHISRRNTGDDDVAIKVLYCGICHSDLHTIKNEWRNAIYPVVPGHEIAGVVTEVGRNVSGFAAGDRVGVGCMVNTCRTCESCEGGAENYCSRIVFTYNSHDRDGTVTRGGYSDLVVADARFVVRFPDALPLDAGAPLLCAGATVYAPMRRHGLGLPGTHVGVVGLGGLGHVAVKFARAFGAAKVTVISTSPGKREEALERLGADAFVLSTDDAEMKAAAGTMHGIVSTACTTAAVHPYLALLRPHGKIVLLGVPDKPMQVSAFVLIGGGKSLTGSSMASIKETQEMLDFAAEHGLNADVEVIGAGEVNAAMERLAKGDVRYRFVIDVGNTFSSLASAL
uniref:Uncharacterized protein n=1 Tax=Avena sativa TaxID=4498 RepID=A0ACD5UE44_AVESA